MFALYTRSRFLIFVVIMLALIASPAGTLPVLASGSWNGQDSLFVPISWCVVRGSPAQANPNLAGDTNTDALIWRRHERPTDNIYANPTGISFRSAINNIGNGFTFPIINDPDTAVGRQGDMRGEDVNAFGNEFNQLVNNCDTAYNNLQRAGIGVTAVNAGLFHNGTTNAAGNANYVTVIGWGGCAENAAGNCTAPYDGRAVVIDNRYLHPASPSRVWPGTNTQFILTDPFDQLVGHEVGHGLSLDHRTNSTALMNPSSADNNSDNQTDNIGLTAAEVTALRTNARNVPGVQIDPQGVWDDGRYVSTRVSDVVQEFDDFPEYLDLASVRVSLDKQENRVFIDQQLFGLIPDEQGEPLEAWYLVDTDGPEQGADVEQLRVIGLPDTKFSGADLIARVMVRGQQTRAEMWVVQNGELLRLRDGFVGQLLTMVVHPHYARSTDPNLLIGEDIATPVHHIINLEVVATDAQITLGKPFRVQTLLTQAGFSVVDRLNDDREEEGVELVVDNPSFPHCTPEGDGTPGGTVRIQIDGLLPDSPIHGLLGADEVFRGASDSQGGGTIDFPIPNDARAGYHLVTIGNDDTALTADCLLNVVRGGVDVPPEEHNLLASHEDLLRRQARAIEELGRLIEMLSGRGDITTDELKILVERYEQLVDKQSDLLKGFEDLIRTAD